MSVRHATSVSHATFVSHAYRLLAAGQVTSRSFGPMEIVVGVWRRTGIAGSAGESAIIVMTTAAIGLTVVAVAWVISVVVAVRH
jgi:hypothetical protein